MQTGLVSNLLYLFGIIPAGLLIYFLIEVNKLLGIRIQRSKFQLKKHDKLPTYIKQLYTDAAKQLAPLGFKVHHCQVSQDLVANAVTYKWSLILHHPVTNVYADISPASTSLDMPGYEVNFWSIAPDGNALLTMNGRGHTVLAEIPGVTVHDPQVLSLHQQYDTHIEERREWSSSTNYQSLFPDEYVKLQQKLMDGYLANLSNEKSIVAIGNNQFRLSIIRCLLTAIPYSLGEMRAGRLLRKRFKSKLKNKLTGTATNALASHSYPVESHIQAFMRLSSSQVRHPSGLLAKSIILLLTLFITYLWLKIPFTQQSLLIVLGVILLHEFGHIVTMLAFNFRDFQILCVSVFGTATTVNTKRIENWKQVIIYLAGPVPGIVISIALIFLNRNLQIIWMQESAIVMLFINYFHLLPFMSLDGGRIMRLTIMERSPIGKVLLPTLSGLVFAAGGFYMAEPTFWVLAMVIFASIPFGLRESTTLSELYKQIKREPKIGDFHTLDWYNKLGRVFLALKENKFRKMNFLQKFYVVRSLHGIITQPKHSNTFSSVAYIGVYLSFLILTLPSLVMTDMITLKTNNELMTSYFGRAATVGQKQKSKKPTTNQEKFDELIIAANQAMQKKDLPSALKLLENAESLYGVINQDNTLAVLFRNYAKYHILNNELQEAKSYLKNVIDLYEKSKTKNYYQLAVSYQNMSDLQLQLSNHSISEHNLEKALSYAIRVEKPEEWHIITDLSGKLLDWYYIEEKQNDIEKFLQSLTDKFKNRDAPIKNYVTKFIYEELGWLHASNNNETAALEKFDQALEIVENNTKSENTNLKDHREETKLLLYKAAVYYKEGYNDFSKIQIENAESLAKQNSYTSLQQYIEKYTPSSISVGSKRKELHREAQRWKLISDAYHKTNS